MVAVDPILAALGPEGQLRSTWPGKRSSDHPVAALDLGPAG
jgi:hypothetical protein